MLAEPVAVKRCLELGDKVNIKETVVKGGYPFDKRTKEYTWYLAHYFCLFDYYKSFGILMKADLDIYVKDSFGRTPLHYAANKLHPKIVVLLILAGANVDSLDMYGSTPLHYAAKAFNTYGGKPGVIRVLLYAGADPNVENTQGKTPVYYLNKKIDHNTPSYPCDEYKQNAQKWLDAFKTSKRSLNPIKYRAVPTLFQLAADVILNTPRLTHNLEYRKKLPEAISLQIEERAFERFIPRPG